MASGYGASESDLKIVQRFFDRCYKRRYIFISVSIYELLQKQDMGIFNRTIASENHPVLSDI